MDKAPPAATADSALTVLANGAPIRSHPPDRLVHVPDEQRNDRSIPRHKVIAGSGQNRTRRAHTPIMSAQAV